MHLSFPSDKSIELAFRVGIAGTSSAPQSVSIVLEREATALSFVANKVGDEWVATINNPGAIFGLGQINLSVNVVLNNRLFVPMKSTAEIVSSLVPQTPQEIPVEAPMEQPETQIKSKLSSLLQSSEAASIKTESIQPTIVKPKIPKIELPKKIVQEETVKVLEPIRLQLLKSVEPGITKSAQSTKIEESKTLPKTSLFRLKRTKIVFK
jgi:hypothetical protein